MRYQGKLTSWQDDRGFGFITLNGGGDRVFVHIKSFTDRRRRPAVGDLVTYEVAANAKGRQQAANVMFVDGQRRASGSGKLPLTLALAFFAALMLIVLAGMLPRPILGFYLAASAIAFLAYAIDKAAARNDRRRIRESTLHLFGLAGGWPGAVLAQRLFRHKSKKASFQRMFWATAIVNCGALGWLLSPSGSRLVAVVLGGR